jgi:hypothetical protein
MNNNTCTSLVLRSLACPVTLLSTADTSQAMRATDSVTLREVGGASKLVHIVAVVPSCLYVHQWDSD